MSETSKYSFGDDWKLSEEKPDHVVKTFVSKNEDGSIKCVTTVFRPILTDEERARRMKLIHDAAVNLMVATYEAQTRLERTYA